MQSIIKALIRARSALAGEQGSFNMRKWLANKAFNILVLGVFNSVYWSPRQKQRWEARGEGRAKCSSHWGLNNGVGTRRTSHHTNGPISEPDAKWGNSRQICWELNADWLICSLAHRRGVLWAGLLDPELIRSEVNWIFSAVCVVWLVSSSLSSWCRFRCSTAWLKDSRLVDWETQNFFDWRTQNCLIEKWNCLIERQSCSVEKHKIVWLRDTKLLGLKRDKIAWFSETKLHEWVTKLLEYKTQNSLIESLRLWTWKLFSHIFSILVVHVGLFSFFYASSFTSSY